MAMKTHTVSSGETLSQIIRRHYGRFDMRLLDMVLAANGLSDPDRIRAGQALKLPGNWNGGADPARPAITDMPHGDRDTAALVSKTQASDAPRAGRAPEKPAVLEKPLGPGDFWKETYHKDLIVLHFTAGYTWESAYSAFRQPGRVAAPFLVDTNGDIRRLFDEKFWAPHLGIRGEHSQNNRHDKRSIGIEIVNIGPVWNRNGKWTDYTGRAWSADRVVPGENRDAHGGAAFPPAQVEAVCALVNWLLAQYRIPRRIPADFFSCRLPAMRDYKGVATHQMFRADKYDLGPAFPFRQLIAECGLQTVSL